MVNLISTIPRIVKKVISKRLWRIWAKALGQKASDCDRESDAVAVMRTFILATYFITNCYIIAGVIRHW